MKSFSKSCLSALIGSILFFSVSKASDISKYSATKSKNEDIFFTGVDRFELCVKDDLIYNSVSITFKNIVGFANLKDAKSGLNTVIVGLKCECHLSYEDKLEFAPGLRGYHSSSYMICFIKDEYASKDWFIKNNDKIEILTVEEMQAMSRFSALENKEWKQVKSLDSNALKNKLDGMHKLMLKKLEEEKIRSKDGSLRVAEGTNELGYPGCFITVCSFSGFSKWANELHLLLACTGFDDLFGKEKDNTSKIIFYLMLEAANNTTFSTTESYWNGLYY